MKPRHTLRGVIESGISKVEVFQNDLRGVGWRVVAFNCVPNNLDANPYVWAKLWIGNDDSGSTSFSDMRDNRCIGWTASGGTAASQWNILDPEHIITNTLRLIKINIESVGYLIELEQMTLTDDEEVMALIKERSQDDI